MHGPSDPTSSRVLSLLLVALLAASCTAVVGNADKGTPGGEETSADNEGDPSGLGESEDPGTAPDGTRLQNGLLGEYFADYAVPALTRVDPSLHFEWPDGTRPSLNVGEDFFSVRWTGALVPRYSEPYTLYVTSDDGVRVWLDDRLVLDSWVGRFPAEDRIAVTFTADQPVNLRIDYFEVNLGAVVKLEWESASQRREVIRATSMRTTAAPRADLRSPRPDYVNPVTPFDCPDPGAIWVEEDRAYYSVCTGGTFPIRRSFNLTRWHDTGVTVLPSGKAPWAGNGARNWAPEIHRVGNRFVVYFTAANAQDKLCIGAAHAETMAGPWTAMETALHCEPSLGVIDATYFQDTDGRKYLYYKPDGNAVGQPTPILVRELADDGLSFKGTPESVKTTLVNDPRSWEGGVIEAPWVVKRGDWYFLFYSGNVYDGRYRTNVARSKTPTGVFEKRPGLLLDNNARWVGPGHGSVVPSNGKDLFVYHAWKAGPGVNAIAPDNTGRNMLVDEIVWDDANGWPTFPTNSPSVAARPAP